MQFPAPRVVFPTSRCAACLRQQAVFSIEWRDSRAHFPCGCSPAVRNRNLSCSPALTIRLGHAHLRAVSADDKSSLRQLYATWGSPPSLRWSSADPCDGSWTGVSCTNGVVDTLNVAYSNLHSTIDPVVGDLTGLTYLYMGQNALSGPIPSTISHLSALQFLNLANNLLVSSLPQQLSTLTSLTFLITRVNR